MVMTTRSLYNLVKALIEVCDEEHCAYGKEDILDIAEVIVATVPPDDDLITIKGYERT